MGWLIALMVLGLIILIFQFIAGGILAALRIFIILAVIAVIVYIVYRIKYYGIPSSSKTTSDKKAPSNSATNDKNQNNINTVSDKKGVRICPKCGSQITDGDFCPKCGTKYTVDNNDVQ